MPSDDYAYAGGGGGALKLKGAKVGKKKKRKDKSDLEKNLATTTKEDAPKDKAPGEEERDPELEDEEIHKDTKTESERRHDELRKKRVCGITRWTRPCVLYVANHFSSYSTSPDLQTQGPNFSRHIKNVSRSSTHIFPN